MIYFVASDTSLYCLLRPVCLSTLYFKINAVINVYISEMSEFDSSQILEYQPELHRMSVILMAKKYNFTLLL